MAAEPTYPLGRIVRITGTFKADDGMPTTPTTTTFTITDPDGTPTDYVLGVASEVAEVSPGVVRWSKVADTPGRHLWHLVGTGAVAEADQGAFFVKPFP